MKLGKLILGGMLLLLPFFSWAWFPPEFQFNLPKLIGVHVLGVLISSAFLWKKVHPSMGASNFLVGLSVVYSGFGADQSYFFLFWTGLITCAYYFSLQENRELFFSCLAYAGAFSASYAYVQMSGHDFILKYAKDLTGDLPISFFGQTTKFGSFIAITSVIALARKRYALFLFQIIPAVATTSSWTIAAICAGSVIALKDIINKKWAVSIGLAGLTIIGSWYLINPNHWFFFGSGRTKVWAAAIDYTLHDHVIAKNGVSKTIKAHPLAGFGPGSFYMMYEDMEPEEVRAVHGVFVQAHNDYVQCFFEFGFLGLAALLTVLGFVFSHYLLFWFLEMTYSREGLSAAAALMAVMINAIGNFPMSMAPHNLVAITALFILLKDLNGRELGNGS